MMNYEIMEEDMETTQLSPMGTVLGVKDIETSIKFYTTLGFELDTAFPHKVRARKIRTGPHGLGVTLTLLVPDLQNVYKAVKKAGLEILLEPVEEFYGDRVFMFLDPDGYEWKISQAIRQVDPEEVAEIVANS
jgi:catechol 2,3-dioxygenase-like lactoylglutathione lyase family enzyme